MSPRCAKCATVLAIALTGAALWPAPTSAQPKISVPAIESCSPVNRPELPPRWRAVGLLSPFEVKQLDVGEFIFDRSLPAMRASLYGLESGAIDLLITPGNTYQLLGPHSGPTGCTSLGRAYRLPPLHWVSEQGVCVGETQSRKMRMQLWKSPAGDARANWHWLDDKTRLPRRSVFTAAQRDRVIASYALTSFTVFEPLAKTELAALRDLCVARTKRGAATAAPPRRPQFNPAGDAERLTRIGKLIPGLSHRACAQAKPVRWPDRFVMTLTLLPTRFDENPYVSLMYYDWGVAKTQLALMLQGKPPALEGLISLKNGLGYRMRRQPSGSLTCEPVYPGIVRPDWISSAGCKCRAVLDHNPTLSADRVTQIFACPIKRQGNRVMWSWYTPDSRPVLFVEAGAQGGGLMLADYLDWMPGQQTPANLFALPPSCPVPGPTGAAPHRTLSNPSCSDCHTTR